MSGKPYTMSEMKSIVDYLTKNKAYGEVKGRKMWLDFERSKLTDRTWQSLKETFIKRILPDIHNPYYKLSITQISSFRQGYDVETKLKNKLEVRSVNEDSSIDVEEPENTEQPSTSNDKEVKENSGEKTKSSLNVSHRRSSIETIVLDPCYETAEEIQRDLESPTPNQKENNENKATPSKSLRDFITYSEPLTPMLQEVIDDFATDEECSDKESNLKIAENENTININTIALSSETDDVSNNPDFDSESQKNNKNQNSDNESRNQNTEKSINVSKSTVSTLETPAQGIENRENMTKQACVQIESIISENSNVKNAKEDNASQIENNASTDIAKKLPDRNKEKDGTSQNTLSQNFSNTTTDTLIPNNQEALNTMCVSINPKANAEPESKNVHKITRKRANSQESTNVKEKKNCLTITSKPASVSDTDAIKRKNLTTGSKSDKTAIPKPNMKDLEKVFNYKNKQKSDEIKKPTEETNDRMVHSSAEGTNNKKKSEERKNENTNDVTVNSNVKNPCLESVSLYEEQFTSLNYSGSSDEVITSTNPNPQEENRKNDKDPEENEVLLLSNSEKDSPGSKKFKKSAPVRTAMNKSEREKSLANVFGFTSGAIARSRKRRISYQNRSARRQSRIYSQRSSSASSEWTSESDTEFVSPPRGRRNKFSKKYLKPKSARILSLEEEGGLFVMYGKKIYPIVKDGKKVKNYVTYAPERDSIDDDESYWKLKYIEEKKRTAKLTKLLHKTVEDEPQSNEKDDIVDLTEPSASKTTKVENYQPEAKTEVPEIPVVLPEEHSEVVKEPVVQDKTLIIKITKKNEEVLQLEGHWTQIHPVLDHAVQIFNKEMENKNDAGSSITSERPKSRCSRLSTPDIRVPAVCETHEKVNKLESEIFKEIETLDKQQKYSATPTSLSTEDSTRFINKRKRGRPKKSPQSIVSESSSIGKEKETRSVTPQMMIEENVKKSNMGQIANGTSTVTRQTRTPKKVLRESTERNESNVINTRTKSLRMNQSTEKLLNDETEVRYKLPSTPQSAKKMTRKSAANKTQNEQKSRNRYNTRTEETFPSIESQWINCVESSQGYQDSDISPIKCLRKKKKSSMTLLYRKSRNKLRRNRLKKTQFFYNEMSDNSSNSSSNFQLQIKNSKHSSLNTSIYRTESYQLLMPKVRTSFKGLDMIAENANDKKDLERPTQNMILVDVENKNSVPSITTEDLGSSDNVTNVNDSSSVTLPPSPVLSIVENISFSKNMSSNIGDHKENACEDENKECNNNDFNITNIDVSMPLMAQNCEFTARGQHVTEHKCDKKETEPGVTESFLNKIFAVNIKDVPSISETVTVKLQNLFLDSANKLSTKSDVKDNELSKIDVEPNNIESTNKCRSKKRCSTPLKRHVNRKTKSNKRQIDTFIEEEHTEKFSQGRKSCPPINYNIVTDGNDFNRKKGNVERKSRKTKESVIKVKITRPKNKNKRRETNPEQINHNAVYEPILIDSGINESGFIYDLNDSVKLIHNHSETCLQASECIGDSIRYLDNSMKSVISLDNSDNSSNTNSEVNSECTKTPRKSNLEAVSRMSLSNAIIQANRVDTNSHGYNSFQKLKSNDESPNSLITEDLSDNEQVETNDNLSKWYLLSEDENTNINNALPNEPVREISCGSNLSKLFTLACAVPNLSAVTEASTEYDDKITDLDENK